MTLRLALSFLFAACAMAPGAFGQTLGPDLPSSTPTVRSFTAGMPLDNISANTAPRFPAASDWKGYSLALSSTAVDDLTAAAKLFSGEAKPGEDKLSQPGIVFVETLMLGMNPPDRAGTRKVVLETVFAGLKRPDEDVRASQKGMTKFFEERATFGNGAFPLTALLRYEAVLAQRSGAGWEDPPRIPVTQALIDAVGLIHRSAEEQKALDAFFAKALASVKDEAAAAKK